jgi:hypothetical protein
MPVIGIIAEGYTDQLVIEAFLKATWTGEDEPDFRRVQPLDPSPGAHGSYAPGGWTVLFQALRDGCHRDALQYCDLLVLHVDADVCDQVGFDVPRTADPDALAQAIEARLQGLLGLDFCAQHGHRICFAVAVDEVECWLLPLFFPKQTAHRSKTTGCLDKVDEALRARNELPLRLGSGKNAKAYQQLLRRLKKKDLLAATPHNPSLRRWVEALTRADLSSRHGP